MTLFGHPLGAENGTRTRDLNLGKVALYQLSYFRNLPAVIGLGLQIYGDFFSPQNFMRKFPHKQCPGPGSNRHIFKG